MQQLSFRPSMDYLRQEAQDLQRSLRRDTVERVTLSYAQSVLAATYGFGSWTLLKARVDRLRLIEQHASQFSHTFARDFPALRDSGRVSMELVEDGALTHPNPAVRRVCIQLLDHLAAEGTFDVLVRALRDPVARVRRHAVHALGCVRCKGAALQGDVVAALLAVVGDDPSDKVKSEARLSLSAFRDDPRVCAAGSPGLSVRPAS